MVLLGADSRGKLVGVSSGNIGGPYSFHSAFACGGPQGPSFVGGSHEIGSNVLSATTAWVALSHRDTRTARTPIHMYTELSVAAS